MEKGNKTVSLYDWSNKKRQAAIINILTKFGHETTKENISMVEYELSITEENRNSLNEFNFDKLVRKGVALGYNYQPNKVEIMFTDKYNEANLITFELYVDLFGKLQTNIKSYEDDIKRNEGLSRNSDGLIDIELE